MCRKSQGDHFQEKYAWALSNEPRSHHKLRITCNGHQLWTSSAPYISSKRLKSSSILRASCKCSRISACSSTRIHTKKASLLYVISNLRGTRTQPRKSDIVIRYFQLRPKNQLISMLVVLWHPHTLVALVGLLLCFLKSHVTFKWYLP